MAAGGKNINEKNVKWGREKGENHRNLDNILLITLRIVQRSEYES